MNRYQNLTIEGSGEDLDAFISRLKETKSPFFFLAKLSKEYAENIYVPDKDALCLKTNRKSLQECKIWLVRMNNTLRVTNITAEKSITQSEYNRSLNAFVSEVVDKIKAGNLQINLSSDEVGLDGILSNPSYKKLTAWIKTCNLDNPISHEADFERWVEFVVSVYSLDPDLSISDFKTGLHETVPSLPHEDIEDLADKLEYSLDFLRIYNENR